MIARAAAVGAFMLATLAACGGAAPPSDTAQRESAVEVTARVVAVNRGTREVMLRTTDGRLLTVELGPEVRNFDQIQEGDTVRAVYLESVVAAMAAVDDTGEPEGAAAVVSAPEGARPAAALGSEVTTVVEFQSFDAGTDTVTFTTPDGLTHSLVVHPAMRDFAMRREPGDRVRVTYTQGLAIAVEETAG
jgi:hypothetical protein